MKYPFATLRKSLRLLIDDNPEALDEVENDISFVYSGYAPISIRLIQCIAQKGGVLSNPAEREKGSAESAAVNKKGPGLGGKVQAHPIVGWKGFEDVVATIPGEMFDIVQRRPSEVAIPVVSLREFLVFCADKTVQLIGLHTVHPREKSTTTVVFFLGGCTYTEIAALRWVGRQNKGTFLVQASVVTIANSQKHQAEIFWS